MLDALRLMYLKTSDKGIRKVFKDLKRGYKPQTKVADMLANFRFTLCDQEDYQALLK